MSVALMSEQSVEVAIFRQIMHILFCVSYVQQLNCVFIIFSLDSIFFYMIT